MSKNHIRVFLADDHEMVREGLAALLAKDGRFRVVGQCGHGLEVLPMVLETSPDVLILDITMPGLNGLDVCRDVVRKAKNTAVLILSMHDNEQFVARALEHGASGYLLKESAAAQLVEAVAAVARGDLYLGPGISRNILQRLSSGEKDPYERLTTRERQVLQLIAEGKTSRAIACELGVAVKTADTHRMRLMRKLDIHNKTSLVKFALRKGLVTLQ